MNQTKKWKTLITMRGVNSTNQILRKISCMRRILFLLTLLFVSLNVFAQQTVSGKVIDESGQALPGVTVLVKGTSIGTITGDDGYYSISNVTTDAILSFSFMGMVTQEITVGNQTNLDVTLEQTSFVLEEIVAIGYGTSTKKEVTGSVASVSSNDFIQGDMPSPLGAIQGKVAGLSVVSSNGSDPTSDYTLRIRGLNSLSGGKSPLIIVDGAVWSGSLSMIDPEQIQTFDILKDGAAAAIYGTRATNGVIMITLKKPERGDVKFEFSSFVSYEAVEKNNLFFTADEYRDAIGTLLPEMTNLDKGANTEWLDEVSRNPLNQNLNLGITGGKENLAFRANLSLKNNQGLFEDNFSTVMAPSIYVTQKAFRDRLTLDYKLFYSRTNSSDIPDGLLGQTLTRNPTEPIYDEANVIGNGYYNNQIQNSRNPVAMLNESQFDREVNFTNGAVNADFKLFEGFSLNFSGSYNSWLGMDANYFTRYYPLLGKTGQAYVGSWNTKNYILEPSIRYNLNIADEHQINAIAGYSYNEGVHTSMSITNANFDTDKFGANNIGAGNDLIEGQADIDTYKSSNKLIAFYGRISYNFMDKYLASVSVRHEGSSRFGANNKWGTFPALSIGWRLNEEPFLEDLDFLDNLKIRAGVGVTGNQDIPNYQSIPRLSTRIGDSSGLFYNNGKWQNVYVPDNNPNPDLKWERKTEYNIGLDFGLFDRLAGSIDIYQRTISDMLWWYNVPVPPNVYDNVYANVGEMTNKGIELLLNADIVKTKAFNWSTVLTWSKNVNVIDKLSDPSRGYELEYIKYTPASTSWGQLLREGEAFGNFWTPVYVGINDDGTIIYEDLNGDGTVDENSIEDRKLVGNEYPDFEAGWQNTLSYNDLFLTFSFRAMVGQDLINWDRLNNENVRRLSDGRNAMKSILDHPEYFGEFRFDDRFLDDGSFVKLDNVVLGYDFKFDQNTLRIYVSGRNLLTFTNFEGNDPEQIPVGINTDYGKYGGDNLSYPYSRTFLLGLKFNF
jgi:TonB-linked SusC/RagA family outer membrane protein